MRARSSADLFVIPDGLQTRWASPENFMAEKGQAAHKNSGRKGSACFPLKAGASKVLAEAAGTSGMIRRIWATISDRSPAMLRGIQLDMYWDGSSKPAVSAPLGDFFCHGLGQTVKFHSALFSSPEGKSFNCCIPMPFRTGMKIEVSNQTDKDVAMFFYDVNYTIGDAFDDGTLYFHAHWRRENPTTLRNDFEFLPKVAGKGRFLGANIGVIADKELYSTSWWGEGEVKIYLDGDDRLPTLCGTGTEDYIGTAWGQGQYDHLYQGCHVADWAKMRYCFYRFHIPDPIYFRQDIRVAMQQIGHAGAPLREHFRATGKTFYRTHPAGAQLDLSDLNDKSDIGLFERQDDWSSCAYFYLDKPASELPPLAPLGKRTEGM